MFKDNNMRPGPTPERVLAICRMLEDNSYTIQEMAKLTQLDREPNISQEAFRYSIETAGELGLIKKTGDKYSLATNRETIASAVNFRRTVSRIIFADSDSAFFRLTEWFIKNPEQVLGLNKFDDFAAAAARGGVESIMENDVLGWRFWIRFLGHAYQYNRTLIPNMKVRLEDAMQELENGTRMTCTQFTAWLRQNVPEAAAACSNAPLPLAVSNGLRTLRGEDKIELISTMDAVKVSLYPLNGVRENDFSEIVV